MLGAAKGGLIYVCNPNNPTASITPKDELRDFIAKTPRETMILVDEAYFHFADSPDYESVIPAGERPPEPDCLPHVFKNLRNGRITLRLLRCTKGDSGADAPQPNVGQRQLHGVGSSDSKSR